MADKSFLDRREGETMLGVFATNEACQTCFFAHGEAPWADTPMKDFCMIYEKADGVGKPDDVAMHGAECDYYEPEEAEASA